jgi:hypothetical protein
MTADGLLANLPSFPEHQGHRWLARAAVLTLGLELRLFKRIAL